MRQLGNHDKTTQQKTVVAQFGEGNFLRAFADYESFLKLARSEDLQLVISKTTEAGIVYDKGDKWRARPLQSVKDSFAKTGELPACLTFSLSALAACYRRGTKRGDACLIGQRDGKPFLIRDDAHLLDFFFERISGSAQAFVPAFLGNTAFWGEDLNTMGDMSARVTKHLQAIEECGMYKALELVAALPGDRS